MANRTGRRAFAVRLALALLVLGANAQAGEQGDVTDEQLIGAQLVARALAYEHGEGVPKDLPRAAALYCKAARDGDAEAQFSLGWMVANGRGMQHDDAVAASLFAMAAASGHEDAKKALRYVGSERGQLPSCMQPPPIAGQPSVMTGVAVITAPDPFATLSPAKRKIADLVVKLAPLYTVDPRLALSVIAAESNFDPAAVSPKDARGLMQLLPETAARFNVRNMHDVKENVRGGLAYLRWLLAYYEGQVELAAAAYNAGEKVVDKYRGIPPYPETRDYVQRVLRYFGREQHSYDAQVVAPASFLVRDDDLF